MRPRMLCIFRPVGRGCGGPQRPKLFSAGWRFIWNGWIDYCPSTAGLISRSRYLGGRARDPPGSLPLLLLIAPPFSAPRWPAGLRPDLRFARALWSKGMFLRLSEWSRAERAVGNHFFWYYEIAPVHWVPSMAQCAVRLIPRLYAGSSQSGRSGCL